MHQGAQGSQTNPLPYLFQQDKAAITILQDTQPSDLSAFAEFIGVSLLHGKSGQIILSMGMDCWILS